ncbi:MAG: energy transducer TonB [Stenotrophomonas sp.]|jgi:protein TonB|uniref:energy transducer TonB n=1 Tax=Stenotrophomonas sp. TaxID=69392 RepID=UPI002850320A|nr:energy transducer TonB [Stenotrophomonas sp.]MDR2958528.1 energy transducer TonB [Stenotrophomonas sp.]
MDTRYKHRARRYARGAIRPAGIAILVVVAVLIAAAWFLIIKPHQDLVAADQGSHPSTPVKPGIEAAPPPVNVAAMSLNQLLAEARKAVNDQRLLSPAGNNAFEFYLKVLEKQPGNQVATDALRETFPVGASVAEQAINQHDFNEAQRQIDLLAKADPANYTLTILRSKLDAQRKLQDREQQLASDKEKQQQLAAQKAASDKAEADRLAAEAQQKALADQRAAQARAAQQQQAAAEARQQQAAPAANAGGTSTAGASGTHPAVLLRNVAPRYPTTAVRANQEGWVEVTFTITPDGSVDDVKVVDAEPRHVFDRAATEAVSRWKFQPATQDGTPVASQDKRRIVFKLN